MSLVASMWHISYQSDGVQKGVDSSQSSTSVLMPAKALAKECQCVVVVTGADDYVTDGSRVIAVSNSCNTDIFFSTYYHLQSVRFESNPSKDHGSWLFSHGSDGRVCFSWRHNRHQSSHEQLCFCFKHFWHNLLLNWLSKTLQLRGLAVQECKC